MQINDKISSLCSLQSRVQRSVLLVALLLTGVFPASAASLLESHVTQLRDQGQLIVAGQPLAAVRALPAFYAARNYQPVWSTGERAGEMLRLIDAAITDGLDPADYHAGTLHKLTEGGLSTEEEARQELSITQDLIRLSVGIEAVEDIIRDLDQALNKAG